MLPGDSDILFDHRETELMFNREIFPLKRSINHKLYTLFEQVKNRIKDTSIHTQFLFPEGTDTTTGKISQGENHKQFPWVMLDFPKLFQPERIFSFRTMFWYGSGFSNSLLIGGNCIEPYLQKFLLQKSFLHDRKFYFSTADDPWDHEIDGKYSALTESISTDEILTHIQKNHFIKISNIFKMNEGEMIIGNSVQNYALLLSILS